MTVRYENGLTKVTPSDGMRLYDGETVAEGEVCVGPNDAPENWREITEVEAKEVEAQKQSEALYEHPQEEAS